MRNMNLEQLLSDLVVEDIVGELNKEVHAIRFDSREIENKDLFVAVAGLTVNGHKFIDKAVSNGASAIVYEEEITGFQPGVTYVKVTDSAESLGHLAAAFYGHPSRDLKLVGITGTNGKTTTTTLLFDLFTAMGYKCGLLSTNINRIGRKAIPTRYTTPDAVTLNRTLAEMVAAGCTFAFMEVSSHAVAQRRIAGIGFTGGVFTNITHDHLLFHKTFDAYIRAKKAFFDHLPAGAFALVNIDDKRGNVMVQNTKARIYSLSLSQIADFKCRVLESSITGLQLDINDKVVFSRLVGHYNAYNLLTAYGVAVLLEMDEVETLTELSNLEAAEGRFDSMLHPQTRILGIVDYAHTPDALENVLTTINEIRPPTASVITVVGCGGDRDQEKRPKMARVACLKSNQVILTSDNPRTEDPEEIIRQMEEGVPEFATNRVLSITNRREAIKAACRIARSGDIILVAGKGHEKYQEINGVRTPFDDKQILRENLFNE